jgi:hypothetical protein
MLRRAFLLLLQSFLALNSAICVVFGLGKSFIQFVQVSRQYDGLNQQIICVFEMFHLKIFKRLDFIDYVWVIKQLIAVWSLRHSNFQA